MSALSGDKKSSPHFEQSKTKEEALQACADQHVALVSCFKTCTLTSSFTGCCTEEHKAFWECYTRERGTNKTRITSWLDSFFGGQQQAEAWRQHREEQKQQRQQQQ